MGLSIGEMIDFLYETEPEYKSLTISIIDKSCRDDTGEREDERDLWVINDYFYEEELCDALWNNVKKNINKLKIKK